MRDIARSSRRDITAADRAIYHFPNRLRRPEAEAERLAYLALWDKEIGIERAITLFLLTDRRACVIPGRTADRFGL
ncbi:hypothetical protein WG908_08130 [Sphingobium sp. AN641]|uniref:hypothetical protein n=1 Tax=Sphingobium sp. AN641 TaxID=3133443 RepID=UPI0030BE07C9